MFFSSLLFLLLISADQLSKYMIRVKGGFYICNPNIALGINLEPLIFWVIWIAIIIIIFFLLIRLRTAASVFLRFAYLIVLAGALSNVIDRLIFGCIIDFIDLRFWPIFNLADVFIVSGVIMLLITNLNIKSKK